MEKCISKRHASTHRYKNEYKCERAKSKQHKENPVCVIQAKQVERIPLRFYFFSTQMSCALSHEELFLHISVSLFFLSHLLQYRTKNEKRNVLERKQLYDFN